MHMLSPVLPRQVTHFSHRTMFVYHAWRALRPRRVASAHLQTRNHFRGKNIPAGAWQPRQHRSITVPRVSPTGVSQGWVWGLYSGGTSPTIAFEILIPSIRRAWY